MTAACPYRKARVVTGVISEAASRLGVEMGLTALGMDTGTVHTALDLEEGPAYLGQRGDPIRIT